MLCQLSSRGWQWFGLAVSTLSLETNITEEHRSALRRPPVPACALSLQYRFCTRTDQNERAIQLHAFPLFLVSSESSLTILLLLFFSTDEMAGAIHVLDKLMEPPNPQRSPEVTAMLASLRAHPRAGLPSAEVLADKTKARGLFDRVIRSGSSPNDRRNPLIEDDLQMYLEVARLWAQSDDTSTASSATATPQQAMERTLGAMREAVRVDGDDPRLLNNLGALLHLEGKFGEAREFYETALIKVAAGASGSASGTRVDPESTSTTILYNLARVYEDEGEAGMAKEAYDKLLSRHPEYVDGETLFTLIFLLRK